MMSLVNKWAVLCVTLICAAATAAPPLRAQDWPAQPIRLVVAFGAGGGADIIARIIGEAMETRLHKPVVIDNKPGAGGIIGNEFVARATPDGYTLGMMTAGQIISAVTRKDMPYETATLTPIAQVASAGLLIAVRPDFAAGSTKELIALAKAQPGKVVFASPGFTATQHFAGVLMQQIAGVEFLDVSFRTSPEAINAVLGKHADFLIETVSAVIGQIQSGNLRALAVTGKDRFPAVPDVPAAAESGVLPGYDVTTWYGLFGPPRLPEPIVAKLNATLMDVIDDPKVRQRMETAGVVVKGSGAAEFGAFMASEYKRWDDVRAAAGIAKQ
jgi:tripartite-type tricarboxylate transporter receptor subunit TctC